ncbi:MAG: hypothetical protein SNJ70_06155 [Armatimonadota bacterium]
MNSCCSRYLITILINSLYVFLLTTNNLIANTCNMIGSYEVCVKETNNNLMFEFSHSRNTKFYLKTYNLNDVSGIQFILDDDSVEYIAKLDTHMKVSNKEYIYISNFRK